MAELKPCPFCGGEAKVTVGNFWAWVKCTECQTATKPFEIENGNKEKAMQEAVELWNRRVK